MTYNYFKATSKYQSNNQRLEMRAKITFSNMNLSHKIPKIGTTRLCSEHLKHALRSLILDPKNNFLKFKI
jgi:hypothetical protein